MTVSMLSSRAPAPSQQAPGRTQILMSPYYGRPDFSALANDGASPRKIDLLSVADVLRNAFVYAPNSIFEDVKLVTFGFCPSEDMYGSPQFHFKFRDSGKRGDTDPAHPDHATDWVGMYHRLLCEAVTSSTAGVQQPWMLQSGGKDSTTLAIAVADARPDTTCLTYLGGREEDEVESARMVARTLGLRHESLVCDPGRAYDRYLAVADRMPLLTADFALLSYVDLATEIAGQGGDGVLDGLGADSYFGMPVSRQQRLLKWLAKSVRLPPGVSTLPLIDRSFAASFLLGTLQMSKIERVFPGSRFTDAEVDEMFGKPVSDRSRARLQPYLAEIASASSEDEWRDMSASIAGSAGAFAKGLYTCAALGLTAVYPFTDVRFREWVYREVPPHMMIDPVTKSNKVLVRDHIATRFPELPYVKTKGSFRFDVRGLAKSRFDTVHDFAVQARDVLPGAVTWLDRNRRSLDNKYHASKFYLLAVVLPWIQLHRARGA
jgi:hypothetical protein